MNFRSTCLSIRTLSRAVAEKVTSRSGLSLSEMLTSARWPLSGCGISTSPSSLASAIARGRRVVSRPALGVADRERDFWVSASQRMPTQIRLTASSSRNQSHPSASLGTVSPPLAMAFGASRFRLIGPEEVISVESSIIAVVRLVADVREI